MSDKPKKSFEAQIGPGATEKGYEFIRVGGYVLGPGDELYFVTSIDNQARTLVAEKFISEIGAIRPITQSPKDPKTPAKTFRFDQVRNPGR